MPVCGRTVRDVVSKGVGPQSWIPVPALVVPGCVAWPGLLPSLRLGLFNNKEINYT